VSQTKIDAERDGVVVPTTLQDYCVMAAPRPSSHSMDVGDFYDDDYFDDDDMDEDDDDMCYDESDSGHGDS
jgi:ubiquitin-conjugating enzyme E2 R